MNAHSTAMFSATTTNQTRHKILNTSEPIAHYSPLGLESLETPDTSHMGAADASGMVVSLTTTVKMLCGFQVMVPETGIVLNDEMNDFSIPNSSNLFGAIPAEINFATPGKRPLSSMAPTIVDFAAKSTFYMSPPAVPVPNQICTFAGLDLVVALPVYVWNPSGVSPVSIQYCPST